MRCVWYASVHMLTWMYKQSVEVRSANEPWTSRQPYPCKTRLNGQVKLQRRKMALCVQVRVFQAGNIRYYAVHSRIVFKTNITADFRSMRNHVCKNSATLAMLTHDVTMPALRQRPQLPYYISPAVPLLTHTAYKEAYI